MWTRGLVPHRSPQVSPHGAAYPPGRRKAHLVGPVALKSLQSTVGELHVEHRHPAAVAHAPTRQPVTPSLLQRRHLATITPPPPSSATAPARRPAPPRRLPTCCIIHEASIATPHSGRPCFFDRAKGRFGSGPQDGHAPKHLQARL